MILKPKDISPDNIPEYYQLSDWALLIEKDIIAVERIYIKDTHNQPILFAQIYIYHLIASYTQLYIPRGPIVYQDNLSPEQQNEFWDNIKTIAKQYKSVFTLIEPSQLVSNQIWDNNAKVSSTERLPHQTQILNLEQDEEDLFKSIHSKMRYNIKLAERKGVIIKKISTQDSQFEKYFDIFFELMNDTSIRGKFAIHNREHYHHLLITPLSTIQASLIIAEYESTVLAANIILDTPIERIYLHGASSNQYRNLMAPPLLQWESIKEAKKLGKKQYDFWGISTTKKSWQGISRFKIQFGGEIIDYPSSKIVIHNYIIFTLYTFFRKLRGKSI
jgi:lipid II:glycine glycyltransferase (peptidoglycan interpeptide bridge formation enzyme)